MGIASRWRATISKFLPDESNMGIIPTLVHVFGNAAGIDSPTN